MDSAPASDLLLPDLIATYLARYAVEGKSPHTIAAYCETLTRFQRCLQEDGVPLDPDRCRPDHEIAYLARFADHRPTTRHRYFREVRCFWNSARRRLHCQRPLPRPRSIVLPKQRVAGSTPVSRSNA